MAYCRVETADGYTVMSNYHLRDMRLSLKARGLLSQILSLPEKWDMTIAGLSKINKESTDAISTAIKELEAAGYITRYRERKDNGTFGEIIYDVRMKPTHFDNPKQDKPKRDALYAKGEKPDAIIDFPVSVTDYEAVDVFNWQDEAAGMISQMEFIRRVDAASVTVERYIREGEIIPDLIVPMSEHRTFKYFTEETLEKTAEKFGWRLINDENRKELFMEMVRQMDMSYSYKPVLIKAFLTHADEKGRIKLENIVSYFRSYYEDRRSNGLVVEKANSIFAKGGYTDKEAQRNILSNPFKRFEDMQMLRHTKTLGIVEVEPTVWKLLTCDEKKERNRTDLREKTGGVL